MDIRYSQIKELLSTHSALKLLRADKAALMLCFLDDVFVSGGAIALPESEICARLEAMIARINDPADPEITRDAKVLIKEWSSDRLRLLRRYNTQESNEVVYEITPQAQKAIVFIASLQPARYVGTQSRLTVIFELLRQLTLRRDEAHREQYIAELKRQRDELDQRIAAAERGEGLSLSPEEFYDNYKHFESEARSINADLREVEYNLLTQYSAFRTQMETSQGPKEQVLDSLFAQTDLISSSEQGKSVQAFEELLLSQNNSDVLSAMVHELFHAPQMQVVDYDRHMAHFFDDLLQQSRRINATMCRLDHALNAYMKKNKITEMKSMAFTCRQVLNQIRNHPQLLTDDEDLITLEVPQAEISLPLDRPLFTVPQEEDFESTALEEGVAPELTYEDLADIPLIDRDKLRTNILKLLSAHGFTTLKEVIDTYGLEYGADELLAYIDLAQEEFAVKSDYDLQEPISYVRAISKLQQLRSEFELERIEIRPRPEQLQEDVPELMPDLDSGCLTLNPQWSATASAPTPHAKEEK